MTEVERIDIDLAVQGDVTKVSAPRKRTDGGLDFEILLRGEQGSRQVDGERPVEIQVFHLQVDLSKLKIGAVLLVSIAYVSSRNIDEGYEKSRRRLFLLGSGFFLLLFGAVLLFGFCDGGEIKIALCVSNDAYGGIVENQLFNPHVPAQEGQKLEVDLQIFGADKFSRRKCRIV